MVAATYLASRSVAFERLFAENFDADLRLRALPQLWKMAQVYFPFGTGFGAFELAYKVIEPFELLRTTYLNQAHNDALQVVIEGGLPALLVVAAFLGWFVLSGWRALRRLRGPHAGREVALAPFAWASLAILVGGCIGDYPLRTPSLMAFAALLCCLIAAPVEGRGRP
jgi:O-antigen ligase